MLLFSLDILELEDKYYRPVSQLPFISKVTESVAMEDLVHHNDYNSTTPELLNACRKHHNCEMALIKLVNDLLWNMEHKIYQPSCLCEPKGCFRHSGS